jgi:hypothetical protein
VTLALLSRKSLSLIFLTAGLLALGLQQTRGQNPFGVTSDSNAPADDNGDFVATRVITVTDDFVTDVYLDGQKVPAESRHVLAEIFGALVEEDSLSVKKGDWLVFHVVNDSLRWNGSCYFGVAGLKDKNDFGFVSDFNSDCWSACDDVTQVSDFISHKDYLGDQKAEEIPAEHVWGDGTPRMKQYAGDSWNGTPLWGPYSSHSVWIKVVIK